MAHVFDVAQFILGKKSNISTMKLQKLVYYSQAYHLVKQGVPLFHQRIEAWVNGPVVPVLYEVHKGQAVVALDDINFYCQSFDLDAKAKESITHVLAVLGARTGSELSELTHSEKPWAEARKGLQPSERSNNLISIESIQSFYSAKDCSNPLFK